MAQPTKRLDQLAGQDAAQIGALAVANGALRTDLGNVSDAALKAKIEAAVLAYLEQGTGVTIAPNGSKLRISAAAIAAPGIITTPTPLTVASGVLPGTVIATLACASLVAPTFEVLTPSGRYAISGSNLVAGLLEIDISNGASDTVSIKATGSNGVDSVTQTFPVTITAGGGFATVDLNLVTAVYVGGSAADITCTQSEAYSELNNAGGSVAFGPNELRRTDIGAWSRGRGSTYIGLQSKTPDAWGFGGWLSAPAKTVQSTSADGFTPIRIEFMNAFGDHAAPVQSRAVVAGENLTFKLKCKPVAGHTATGARLALELSNGDNAYLECPDLTVANPVFGGSSAAGMIRANSLSARKLADGTVEMIAGLIVTAGATSLHTGVSPVSSVSGAGPFMLDVWGLQVEEGTGETGWVATTTAAVTKAADDIGVAGASALAALLAGATGSLMVETQALEHVTLGTLGVANSTAGALVKIGATEVLKPKGPTAFTANAVEGALGVSGWRGIVRTVIAWDAAGWYAYANGSKVASANGAFNHAGAIKLLAGISGRLRRIAAGPTKISSAEAKTWSNLHNRTFVRPGTALVIGAATITLYDDFDGTLNDSLRSQTTRAFPYGGHALMAASYDIGPGKWIPRYHFHDQLSVGMHVGFNNEPQMHTDPCHTGNWTGSHVVANSRFELWCKLVSELTAGEQAQIPINALTGVKHRYASGVASTVGHFVQKFGVFSSRAKLPAFMGSWSSLWAFSNAGAGGSEAEQDIEEYHGRATEKTKTTAALHLFGVDPDENINYGYNDLGYDLSLEDHDRTGVWTSTKLEKYFDGELLASTTIPQQSIYNQAGQHLIMAFDLEQIEETSPGSGVPHADRPAMEAALVGGQKMSIDRWTVFQFGV